MLSLRTIPQPSARRVQGFTSSIQMRTPPKPPASHSYWLKCWREETAPGGESIWRFSLENPHTRERLGFAGLSALTRFLREQVQKWNEEEAE